MKTVERLNDKPLEVLAALALLSVGIVVAALAKDTWIQVSGGAIAAIGGALLSHLASDVNAREKAVDLLRSELQSMSRHLADTASKMSRSIQLCQRGLLDSDMAIDRVAQLTTNLYGIVNDVHVLVGAPPDLQTLVDTVSICEQTAERLEQLSSSTLAQPNVGTELADLREKLESARLALSSAKKEFSGVDMERIEAKVACPTCTKETIVKMGKAPGDSAMHTCTICAQRFHIHRKENGEVIVRPFGGNAIVRLDIECPECKNPLGLSYHTERPYEDRYCMKCLSLLRVNSAGRVQKFKDASPITGVFVGYAGDRCVIRCPSCSIDNTSIWKDGDNSYRAVCRDCSQLLVCGLSHFLALSWLRGQLSTSL